MKKKASIETTATAKKPEVKKETKTTAAPAPKKKAEVKKYSLVIEGLTKTQAETLMKLLQNSVQAKIV